MEIQDIAKFLINPIIYVFLGIILLLFINRHRIKLTLCLVIFLYVISVTFTGYIFSRIWRVKDTFSPDISYDAVVVLSGVSDGAWHLDRENLPYIPEDFFASDDDTDRILAGIYFVQAGKAKLLLIGDSVHESRKYGMSRVYYEGKFVMKLAADMGLKENQIQIYGRVKRTLNEAEGVKEYVQNHQLKNLLLVTSEIHMRRALSMFKKKGLNPDIFSVNKEEEITWDSFIPQAKGISKS